MLTSHSLGSLHRGGSPDLSSARILQSRAGAPYALRPVELSHQMLVTTGAVTKRVDRLAAQGYVDREATADDGRGKLVRLTPAGLELVDRMIAEHLATLDSLLGTLDPTERETLAELLSRLAVSLEG